MNVAPVILDILSLLRTKLAIMNGKRRKNMKKEQLLKLLKTGVTDADTEGRVIAHRIEDMDEKELRESVIEFVYSK